MYHFSMTVIGTNLNQMARHFQALSDETRLQIVEMLTEGEKCVCDLQDAVGAAQSRLSFHLKVLREAGLVSDRKQGRWNFYSLRPEVLEAMATYLQERTPDEAAWNVCGCDEVHEGRCCG